MKRLTSLLQYTFTDVEVWCRTSTQRDLKEVLLRVEHEGESFLTLTLPNFGKDFEKSLDQGFVDPSLFLGFERKGALPLFLGGLLDHVFDRDTGVLLDILGPSPLNTSEEVDEWEWSLSCIRAIRQLTLMFGKLDEASSTARERRAILDYLVCEDEVKQNDARFLEWLPAGKAGKLSEIDINLVWTALQYDFRKDFYWSYSAHAFLWGNG